MNAVLAVLFGIVRLALALLGHSLYYVLPVIKKHRIAFSVGLGCILYMVVVALVTGKL